MNVKRLLLATFRAVSCLYEESPNEAMRDFLSDSNHYIFKDRLSADPAFQAEFEQTISNCDIVYDNSNSLYDAVYSYLQEKTSFADSFLDISMEEWSSLCDMVDEECDNENVLL